MDLSIVLLELVVNSLDAGASLVRIDLKAGRRVWLRVRDDGRGMDSSALKRASEKGFSQKGGSGLGLYKIEQTANANGGSLKIRSKEGKGTTAIVRANSGMETGDIASSLAAAMGDDSDIVLRARVGKKRIKLDTRRARKRLGDMSSLRAIAAIKKYVNENLK